MRRINKMGENSWRQADWIKTHAGGLMVCPQGLEACKGGGGPGQPVSAGTTRDEAEPVLDSRPDARSVEESSTQVAGFIAGLRRARSWRVPPNWSAIDWHEELRAVALAAAWQAGQDHDPSRGVPLGGFVYFRVQAQALTRYRQEWRDAPRVAAE